MRAAYRYIERSIIIRHPAYPSCVRCIVKPWSHHLIFVRLHTCTYSVVAVLGSITYEHKERGKESHRQAVYTLTSAHSLTPTCSLTHTLVTHSLTHPLLAHTDQLLAHLCALLCPASGLSRARSAVLPVWLLTHSLSPFRFAPGPAPDPDQPTASIFFCRLLRTEDAGSAAREKKARGRRRAKTGAEIAEYRQLQSPIPLSSLS